MGNPTRLCHVSKDMAKEGWIVVPAYDEAADLPRFLDALIAAVAGIDDVRFVVLVVDDGSRDGTADAARAHGGAAGVEVRAISFVRNFGQQAALVAGLLEAAPTADFVVTIDADGEQPPELIAELVDAWRGGAAIVHTARAPHRDLSAWKRWSSGAYYTLLAKVSGLAIRGGMADFKLWDGALVREIASFLPACGSTRVFAAWLAPRAPCIDYEQQVVPARRSRFSFRRSLSLALNGIVRYSDFPLRISIILSAVAICFGVLYTFYVIWAAATHRVVPGWSSLVILVSFFGGLQCFGIGVLGEYLSRLTFRRSLPTFVRRGGKS
jgi:dolichol-phosphate mannosyltransferase